jgi:hypothetical protein
MAGLFNLKEIKAWRKCCQGIRTYIKAWRKFRNAVEASTEPITEASEAYMNYVEFMRE